MTFHHDPNLTRRTLLAGSAAALIAAGVSGCSSAGSTPPSTQRNSLPDSEPSATSSAASPSPTSSVTTPVSSSPQAIAARATVPVLCWHQLRNWKSSDTAYNRQSLIIPPRNFTTQLDALVASGYTTISPDQYLAHLTHGAALPPKPVMLSFDDAQGSQMEVALPELRKRKMTGTFFIMTVVLGQPGWMNRQDVQTLHRDGMTIGSHTWDHHRADQYHGNDWKVQLDQPRALLEKLIDAPVRHFAYPYGAWNSNDFPHLKSAGYATAFQLSDRKMDRRQPLYTLRRVLMDSTWGPSELRTTLEKASKPAVG